MGRVYLAFDPKFNREVALKVIRDTMVDDERVRKWFHREARAIAQLQHPGVVEVHDYSGQDAPVPYLVMERLHGHTLKDVIQKRGVCSAAVLCEIAIQLGVALEHAHTQGLVHRDLKPDNLFVEPSGRIVITDFGLARAQLNVDLGASLASMGTNVVGTPLFLAPEAIHDPREAGPKSDVYAVGVILYYAASLKLPYQADDPFQALSRILSGQHAHVQQHRKDLPRPLCDAIERTFAFDATKRVQSGGELEALFTKLRDGLDGGPDSLQELVAFLHQTDEFNTFTKATHIGAPEVNIPTPPADSDMATHPNPITVTVQTPLQGAAPAPAPSTSQNTVVSRRDQTQVVSRTQVVTAKATNEETLSARPSSRSWLLVAGAAVAAVAIIASVIVWQQRVRARPKSGPAVPVVAENAPPLAEKAPELPPPMPSEQLAVPKPLDVPDLPKEPPKTDPKRPAVRPTAPQPAADPGTLRVNTGPIWADIFVNNEKKGQTPFKAAVELPPGKYRVRLVNPDYGTQEHQVVITPGETTLLKVTLGKK